MRSRRCSHLLLELVEPTRLALPLARRHDLGPALDRDAGDLFDFHRTAKSGPRATVFVGVVTRQVNADSRSHLSLGDALAGCEAPFAKRKRTTQTVLDISHVASLDKLDRFVKRSALDRQKGVLSMRLSVMTKAADTEAELVRSNLVKFREEAELSQAEAADLSGVALDNLRRYETGTTTTIPGVVLRGLALAYGHAMEDFYLEEPPPARLGEAPVFFLRTRPGVDIDQDIYDEIRVAIDNANKKVRGKKPRK